MPITGSSGSSPGVKGEAAVSDANSSFPLGFLDKDGNLRIPASLIFGIAPDGDNDRIRTVGDTAGVGLGVLAIGSRTPGASEIKQTRVAVAATSVDRATVITPTSGKKVRVLAIFVHSMDATATPIEVYFGTGANITSTIANAIFETVLDLTDKPSDGVVFPDGGGPVGAADAVVSWRTDVEIGTGAAIVLVYREE